MKQAKTQLLFGMLTPRYDADKLTDIVILVKELLNQGSNPNYQDDESFLTSLELVSCHIKNEQELKALGYWIQIADLITPKIKDITVLETSIKYLQYAQGLSKVKSENTDQKINIIENMQSRLEYLKSNPSEQITASNQLEDINLIQQEYQVDPITENLRNHAVSKLAELLTQGYDILPGSTFLMNNLAQGTTVTLANYYLKESQAHYYHRNDWYHAERVLINLERTYKKLCHKKDIKEELAKIKLHLSFLEKAGRELLGKDVLVATESSGFYSKIQDRDFLGNLLHMNDEVE